MARPDFRKIGTLLVWHWARGSNPRDESLRLANSAGGFGERRIGRFAVLVETQGLERPRHEFLQAGRNVVGKGRKAGELQVDAPRSSGWFAGLGGNVSARRVIDGEPGIKRGGTEAAIGKAVLGAFKMMKRFAQMGQGIGAGTREHKCWVRMDRALVHPNALS